ncbi:MAG: phytanoyl-CoA dioxygenase family protein [Gammaproteobacteria bacterium]|nr:phytanoyl-CoA dioxygenase family protein [Gammaproteobacteria bacterium]
MKCEEIFSHPALYLEQAQRELYYEQGYLAFPGLIQEQTLASLRAALEHVIDLSREITCSGNKFDLEKGHTAENPRLRRATYVDDFDPVFWELCSSSIVSEIAADLLGPNIRFRELMANFKWAGGGAEVKWHQDIAFYPHTNAGTCQFLLSLEDIGSDQGPLQVIPGSHKGRIYEHYDSNGEWTGAIRSSELGDDNLNNIVELTGSAGTVTVHHSRTVHGSAQNMSAKGRPVLVVTYSAADAIPYTAVPYPSSHYGVLVRGSQPRYAHHEEMQMPLPPDWSSGYTSIFAHQHDDDAKS